MTIVANVLVSLVGVMHLWFMVLESFLWTKPIGLKTFGKSREYAETTKVLAQNQGLYNGFLGAGLFWGLCSGNKEMTIFLLGCVILAGIVGGITVDKKIFVVQSLPAVAALIFYACCSSPLPM